MVFKIAKCYQRGCNYLRFDSKPLKAGPLKCKKCGADLRYLEKWAYRFEHRGKVYVKLVGTKRETEDALYKKRVEIRERRFFDAAPETNWDVAKEKFLTWAKTNTKPGTYRMYALGLSNFDKKFKGYALNEITPDMIEAHKQERISKLDPVTGERATSNATINRDIASIKRLLSWAMEQKLLERSLIENVPLLKEAKERIRWLTDDEMERLLNACQLPYLKMGVIIALETGLREHGCFTLMWKEIDDHGIHKEVKAGKFVHIPVTNTLQKALAEYKQSCVIMSRYVIPSPNEPSEPCPFPKKAWSLALKRAKITDFRFHDLRHTFATTFLQRGGKLENLRAILGHSDITTTMKYAHVVDEAKRQDMEKFERGRKK
jgi:integrase